MAFNEEKINHCLVAFIDVLGFKNKLNNVKNDSDLITLKKSIEEIHSQFMKDDEDILGRKVLALSDAVVIIIDFEDFFNNHLDLDALKDQILSELSSIGLAQLLCHQQGIFLRGGITFGQFYFNNDILISKALAEVYQMESNEVCVPMIKLSNEIYDLLNEENQYYAWDIIKTFLKKINLNEKKLPEFYALNYLQLGFNDLEDEEFDIVKNNHFEKINYNVQKYKNDPHIQKKYLFLKNYHEDFFKLNR